MFSLTIAFGPQATLWSLLYADKAKAESALAYVKNVDADTSISLEDEFGQIFLVTKSEIVAVLFEDMAKSKLGHIERALHQSRMQAEGQKLAQSDPALRAAAASAMGSPSIISPMNGFGRG